MRVIHVIAGIEPGDGGPSYSVPRLSSALHGQGIASEVLSPGFEGSAKDEYGATVRYFPHMLRRVPILRRLYCSPLLRDALCREDAIDLIHSHGLWCLPNLYADWAATRRGTPTVISTRGMLSAAALSISRVPKAALYLLGQRRALLNVTCLHATSEAEREDIRRFGLTQPIAVIPNGIDIPEATAAVEDALKRQNRYALFLGRIHPIKSLDTLIQAWAGAGDVTSKWRLKIVGPADANYKKTLQRLIAELALQNVDLQGEIYGTEKEALFQGADLFIMPSRTENFGIAIAESLAHGVPAISTKGAPWSGLRARRCGWWVDFGVPSLSAAVRDALSLSAEERHEMGVRGRKWMEGEFAWSRIAGEMIEVYGWLRDGGARPAVVEQ